MGFEHMSTEERIENVKKALRKTRNPNLKKGLRKQLANLRRKKRRR